MTTRIAHEPVEVPGPDGPAWRWAVETDDGSYDIDVFISGTAASSDPDGLPSPVDEAVRTKGRDALERLLLVGTSPAAVIVHTQDVVAVSRRTIESAVPGELVFVRHPDDARFWSAAVIVRPGERDEAEVVDDPRVSRSQYGEGQRARDVVWVRVLSNSRVLALPYGKVHKRVSAI